MPLCKLRKVAPLTAQHIEYLKRLRNLKPGEQPEELCEPGTTQECVTLMPEIRECACSCRPETRGGEPCVIAAKVNLDQIHELHKEVVSREDLEQLPPIYTANLSRAGVHFSDLNKLVCEITKSGSLGTPPPGSIIFNIYGKLSTKNAPFFGVDPHFIVRDPFLGNFNPNAREEVSPGPEKSSMETAPAPEAASRPAATEETPESPAPGPEKSSMETAPAPEAASRPAAKEETLEAPAHEPEVVLPPWLTCLKLTPEEREKFQRVMKFIANPGLCLMQRLFAAILAGLDEVLVKNYRKGEADKYMAEFCGDSTKFRDAQGCRCRFRDEHSKQDDRYDLKAKYPDFAQFVRAHLNL